MSKNEHRASDERPEGRVEVELGYNLKSQQVGFKVAFDNPFDEKKKRVKNPWSLGLSEFVTGWVGKRDAKNGTPTPESTQLATREEKIVKAATARTSPIGHYLETYRKAVLDFISLWTPASKTSVDEIKAKIQAKATELAGWFKGRLQSARKEWADSVRERLETKEKLTRFRTDNRLVDRKAEYPPNWGKPALLLGTAFLIDGVINATLFAGASSMGLLGGLMISFILSGINVAFGATAGFIGFRNAFWRGPDQTWRRPLGIAIATIFVLLGLFLNLFVAHFRDLAEKTIKLAQENPDARIVSIENIDLALVGQQMQSDILGLHSIMGLLLLFTGLAVFLYAAYEGYTKFDDSYPKYGALDRAAEEADARVRQWKEIRTARLQTARAFISSFLDSTRKQIADAIALHEWARTEIQSATDSFEKERNQAAGIEKRLWDAAYMLLNKYRQTNREMRSKARINLATPSRFADNPPHKFETVVIDAGDIPTRRSDALMRIDANLTALREVARWLEEYARARTAEIDALETTEEDEELEAERALTNKNVIDGEAREVRDNDPRKIEAKSAR
jgi:hypothetical protein